MGVGATFQAEFTTECTEAYFVRHGKAVKRVFLPYQPPIVARKMNVFAK